MKHIFFISIFCLFSISASYAQKATGAKRAVAGTSISDQIKAIEENLEGKEAEHFQTIYSNYMLISTVNAVQKDVSRAIEACGENNPEMKLGLDSRYSRWSSSVGPVMRDALGHLNNMLVAQDYVPEQDVRSLFESMDDARERTSGNKVPVSTEEACGYLINSMDQSEETMLSLLRQTLVSVPQGAAEQSEDPEVSEPESEELEDQAE